jgi:hypothetical protein
VFLGLVDTREQPPDGESRRRFELPEELRPWRWLVATVVLFAVGLSLDGWPGVIAVFVGLGCFLQAMTSYYSGNDGLSKYRQ